MSKKEKHTWNPNVFERNAVRYYESEDSDDDIRVKRKEGQNKLEEMRRRVKRNINPSKLTSYQVRVQARVQVQ
jgi:hypothetical protein